MDTETEDKLIERQRHNEAAIQMLIQENEELKERIKGLEWRINVMVGVI